MSMKYPENLKKNGTIGFAAPSFGASIEPYKSYFTNALKKFGALGFKTYTGPNCFLGDGIGISNTPKECARELTEMFTGQECDALISVGGGELMCEILPYVDFDKIRESKPKWFLGYSDNTNFTYTLAVLCGIASIYGPCASSFGMEPWHESLKDALGLMTGEKTGVTNYKSWEKEDGDAERAFMPYNCTEPFEPVFYNEQGKKTDKVRAEGRLIGGCLDCLVTICGTRFDKTAEFCEKYKEDGIIWFLESCDLNTIGFRRAMWQLKNAGWFRYCRGIIFGRPGKIDDRCCGLDWEGAMLGQTEEMRVPIIMNADLGHLPPMMPLICGGYARIFGDSSGEKPAVKINYILK